MEDYNHTEFMDVVALLPLVLHCHSSRITIFVTLEILTVIGKVFCSPTLHSGTALLDVVMLAAALLTLVRGLTLP